MILPCRPTALSYEPSTPGCWPGHGICWEDENKKISNMNNMYVLVKQNSNQYKEIIRIKLYCLTLRSSSLGIDEQHMLGIRTWSWCGSCWPSSSHPSCTGCKHGGGHGEASCISCQRSDGLRRSSVAHILLQRCFGVAVVGLSRLQYIHR